MKKRGKEKKNRATYRAQYQKLKSYEASSIFFGQLMFGISGIHHIAKSDDGNCLIHRKINEITDVDGFVKTKADRSQCLQTEKKKKLKRNTSEIILSALQFRHE